MADIIVADKLDFIEVANAIREKGGTADALAFPAGFAEAIASIDAGLIDGSKYVCGSFTPNEDIVSDYTVNHDPLTEREMNGDDIILLWTRADSTLSTTGGWDANTILGATCITYRHPSSGVENSSQYNYIVNSASTPVPAPGKKTVFRYFNYQYKSRFTIVASSTQKLAAGKVYCWLRFPNRY